MNKNRRLFGIISMLTIVAALTLAVVYRSNVVKSDVLKWSFIYKDRKINTNFKSGKDLTIFTATDIHHLSKSLRDEGQGFKSFMGLGDGKQTDYTEEIIDAFVNDINKKKPDILIISGDLTNNGEKKSHLELAEKLKRVEESGTLVYLIPGNHDISNPWARSFQGNEQYKAETINYKEFSKIYNKFGYGEAISRDKTTLSYLAAPSEDLWLLMVDTNQYKNNEKNGSPQTDGRISKETLQWIKKCSELAKKNNAEIVTVMHHNLLTHSDLINKNYTINNSEEAIKVFEECGLNLVLSGHIHIQDINYHKVDNNSHEKYNKNYIYEIVTSALSVYPQQYGVIKYSSNNGYNYSTAKVEVEAWAKETGNNHKNLNDFSEFSRKSFENNGYFKAYDVLYNNNKYSEEEKKLMCELVGELNLSYFSGTQHQVSQEYKNTKAYKLWEDSQIDFFKRYIKSITKIKDINNNKIFISNTF